MYDTYKALSFERSGKVLIVRIDNPPINAMSRALHSELVRVWPEIQSDPDVNAVVFTGKGEQFCTGGDMKDLRDRLERQDHTNWVLGMQEARRIVYNMLDFDKPVVAAVNGHAIGLGATLALFCDIVVADEAVKIADTHVKVGLVAGDGGALIWPQNMGFARAKEYLLTGRLMTGRQAADLGLINHAVAGAEVQAKAMEIAQEIAALPALATAGTKTAINAVLRRTFAGLMENHLGLETLTYLTPDHREAVSAFLEKRKPRYGADRDDDHHE